MRIIRWLSPHLLFTLLTSPVYSPQISCSLSTHLLFTLPTSPVYSRETHWRPTSPHNLSTSPVHSPHISCLLSPRFSLSHRLIPNRLKTPKHSKTDRSINIHTLRYTVKLELYDKHTHTHAYTCFQKVTIIAFKFDTNKECLGGWLVRGLAG